MNMMRLWLHTATEDERLLLALEAGTSRGYLDQLAGGHRVPKPELAAAIEAQALAMHKDSEGRLPVIYRTDLVPACARCAFAEKCLGAEVVNRNDFDVVEG